MSRCPPCNRRWIRIAFRLRTLLLLVGVVGSFFGWLASEMNLVRQRQEYRDRLASFHAEKLGFGRASTYFDSMWVSPCHWAGSVDKNGTPTIPVWRRWLGDEAYGYVELPIIWPECELKKARSLFPEARVCWRRELLRRGNNRYLSGVSDAADWTKFASHELEVSIPAEDAPRIQTVDDAIQYALEQKSNLRREHSSAQLVFACPSF